MKQFTLLCLLPTLAWCQSTTTTSSPSWTTGVISEDGTCGPEVGRICDPAWGACCSASGICGRSNTECGAGCQPLFGNCDTPIPAPGPGSQSPDGSCGGVNQFTCAGSPFGGCCSSGGWCGSTPAHCGIGCQNSFGKCTVTSNVSNDGTCGANGKTCKGSKFGDCCSSGGFCGLSSAHCGKGCQSTFGTCTTSTKLQSRTATQAENISVDGTCGKNGKTCKGSGFGDCCSPSGFCGASKSHCGKGCQVTFGTCDGSSDNVSIDGTCGANGKTCKGSKFGDCCSSSGFCGLSSAHCGKGCQSTFGSCTTVTKRQSEDVSVDGTCGANGKTCKGSKFGDCCSSTGFCGQSTAHCGKGCQSPFGTCTANEGSISIDGTCGKNGKTCKDSGFGDCCSASGFCGQSTAHCGKGCQLGFGNCS